MHRPEIEPVPELFDIHVMAFADESSTTVDALARVFAIGRDEAQRLIADAPVVVKRAASPAIADALLDVLGGLGAQVVLLPSQTVKAQAPKPPISAQVEAPEPSEGDADDERDFFASGPMPSDPAPAPLAGTPAAWGGLDLEAPLRGQASAPRALLDDELVTHAAAHEAPARPSLTPPRSAPYASFAPPSSARYVAPEAELDREASFDEREESSEETWGAPSDASAEDGEPAPAAEDAMGSLELAVPLPARRMTQHEPPPPPSRGPPPAPGRRAGPPQPAPDLGLGLVPPLPGLGSLPPLPPPGAGARPSPAVSGKASGLAGPRAPAARAPAPAPLLSERPRPVVRAAAHAQGRPGVGGKPDGPRPANAPLVPQSAWLSRADVPSGPDLPRFVAPSGVLAPDAAAPASPAPPSAQAKVDERSRPRAGGGTSEALPRLARRKSRLVATLELVAGMAVFAIGLQLDNTVLHGNADGVWLALHAFGLYGIGSGLHGLRP